MNYVVGFCAAVPSKNKSAYIKHAKLAAKILKEHGALRVVECWGDDVPPGKVTSFPMAVKCKKTETVIFSWVEWPSKKVGDKGMQKFMDDPRMENKPMPFDGGRMIYGGFKMVLNE